MNPRRLAREGLVVKSRKPNHYVDIIYDSAESPEISDSEAKEILDNQEKWNKLSLGEKLNVVRAYSYGIAGQLDIKAPDIHLANYNLKNLLKMYFAENRNYSEAIKISLLTKFLTKAQAFSIEAGFIINISHMKIAANVRNAVAHEMKHIHQYYAIDSNYKPRTLPSQEEINDWEANIYKTCDGEFQSTGKVNYGCNPAEDDARKFADTYTKMIFGIGESSIVDTLGDKIYDTINRRSIRKSLKRFERFKRINTHSCSPQLKK